MRRFAKLFHIVQQMVGFEDLFLVFVLIIISQRTLNDEPILKHGNFFRFYQRQKTIVF